LLLAFLAAPSGKYETDQVRIMKGLFLLSREGPDELRALYTFAPYDYGPFDKAVYADLDDLVWGGLVRVEQKFGSSRRVYRLTDNGRQEAARVRNSIDEATMKAIEETKQQVTNLSFNQLLRYVYGRHPDMATRTRFKS
jgi:DNA-binding PadR family transcriptional regulator